MKRYNAGHEKLDRKIVERNRRIHMKDLCFKLNSLIPPHHLNSSQNDTNSQGMHPRQHHLDEAGTYIKLLEKRVEELKARRAALTMSNHHDGTDNDGNTSIRIKLPVVELREYLGSSLEVVLTTGLKKNFAISEVIGVIEDEGAEVVSASFSTVGDKVFHTLHAQVKICRVGVDTAKVCQRLKELVC